jgi:hypothetical protein
MDLLTDLLTGRFVLNRTIVIRTASALGIVLLVTCLSACSIEKPQTPSWDTELVLPLISHHYDMLELVDRMADDALSYDSLGNISFSVEQDMDTVAVDAGLSIPDLSTAFSETIGLIEISGPAPVTDQIYLSDYLALGGDVPALTLNVSQQWPAISDIESATIASGSMVVTATNNFDLPVDTVTIAIVDDTYALQIGAVTFEGGLGIGETKSETIDLSGKTISSSFTYDTHLYTPGGTILTLAEKTLVIEAGFSSTITVSSAVAKVPAQERSYDQDVSFSEDNQITSANIKGGTLILDITNGTNLSSEIDVTIEEFTRNGNPLSFTVDLPPQQTSNVTRDLAGYEFVPLPSESTPTINVSMDVSLPGSGSNTVEISSTDDFAVDVQASGLEFSSVSGIIAPTVVEIAPVTESIEIPSGFENFSLTSAVMTMEFHSAVNLPAELSIRIEGDAGQLLTIADNINPGTVGNPGVTTLVVDQLSEFLSPIPSEITITGSATVGDGVTPGGVTEDDFVWGRIEITSPLEMSVGATEFEADINKADIDADDIDEITDRLNHGSAYTHIANHLPLGASLTLYLGGDSLTLYDDPELTIGPIEVSSGIVGAGGLVVDSVGSDNTIELTHEDLQILNNETLYIGQIITFPGTNGESVRIVSSDYLDVQAYITVSTRIGDF